MKKIIIVISALAIATASLAGTILTTTTSSQESGSDILGMKSKYLNVFYEMWATNYNNFSSQLLQPVLGGTPSINTVSLGFMEWVQGSNGNFQIYSGTQQGTSTLINEFLTPPTTPANVVDPEYYAWTYAKFQNPQVKMLLSFGGYTFGGMWDQLAQANQSQIESLAQTIVNACNTNYPVYNNWSWWSSTPITQVGTATLSGVDFDFEPTTGGTSGQTEVITTAQTNAIASLIADIHQLSPNLMITLDGRACSADGAGLPSSMGPTGQAPATAGELTPLLQSSVMNYVTYVNVMGYDSGSTYYDTTGYQQSLANYAHYIGASKVVGGLSGCAQYEGITDTLSSLENKANFISNNGYAGGSFWAVGPDLISVIGTTPMSTYTTGIANNL